MLSFIQFLEAETETPGSKLVRQDKKVALDKVKDRLDNDKDVYKQKDTMIKNKFKKDAKIIKDKSRQLRPPGAKRLK